MDLDGAGTNRHLFRVDAPRPTTRRLKSCSGRPQSGLIGKSTGYSRETAPSKSKRNPLLAASCGQQARATFISCGGAMAEAWSLIKVASLKNSPDIFAGEPGQTERNPLHPYPGGEQGLVCREWPVSWGVCPSFFQILSRASATCGSRAREARESERRIIPSKQPRPNPKETLCIRVLAVSIRGFVVGRGGAPAARTVLNPEP